MLQWMPSGDRLLAVACPKPATPDVGLHVVLCTWAVCEAHVRHAQAECDLWVGVQG